jgi:uncharacterized protein YegL
MTLLLPVYIVIDESDAMRACQAELGAGLLALCDALRAEPMTAAKLRVTVLGMSDVVRVRLPMSDMRAIGAIQGPVIGGRASYAATFADLLARLPADVAALKSAGHRVQRPAVFFLTATPVNASPAAGEAQLWQQLTDRAVTPAAPAIVACAIAAAPPAGTSPGPAPGIHPAGTATALATQPEFAFTSVPGTTPGSAVTAFFSTLAGNLLASGALLGSTAPQLVVSLPAHFATTNHAATPPVAMPSRTPSKPRWMQAVQAATAKARQSVTRPARTRRRLVLAGAAKAPQAPGAAPRWAALVSMTTAPPRRHYLTAALAAAGIAIAVVAGVVVWASGSAGGSNLQPVTQALAALASAPGLEYQASLPGGISEELQVTAGGQALGKLTFEGLNSDLLMVGGKVYAKFPDGLLPGTSGLSGSDITGKWVTGAAGLPGPGLSEEMTPAAFALSIFDALNPKTAVVRSAGMINAIPALRVQVPEGALYVSKEKPYRVLKYVPDFAHRLPSTFPSLPSPPDLPSTAADTALIEGASFVSGETDIAPMSLEQASQAYGNIEADTAQLTSSVNADIVFTLQGSANVQCSAGGCTVGATVSDSYITGSGTQVTGGLVTAFMTGTVTINGLPGGSCTATTTFPAHGIGSVSCYDLGAGAVWQEAQTTAAADAEASGANSYQVLSTAEVTVQAQALVQAEVTRLITQERQDQQYDTCQPASTSASVYPPDPGFRLADTIHATGVPANCGRFAVNSQGEAIDLSDPDPAITRYVKPTDNGKGEIFDIDPKTMGISNQAVAVRVMGPDTGGKYEYPNGYVSYLNASGQTINPLTGRSDIQSTDPLWHIPRSDITSTNPLWIPLP